MLAYYGRHHTLMHATWYIGYLHLILFATVLTLVEEASFGPHPKSVLHSRQLTVDSGQLTLDI